MLLLRVLMYPWDPAPSKPPAAPPSLCQLRGWSQPAIPFLPAPPQLQIGDGESHLTAVANDSLRIHCHATGIPTPQIQ